MKEVLKFVRCWIILLSLIAVTFGFLSDVSLVEMTPINPVVEDGGTLVLNCTFTPNYTGPANASHFTVGHNNREYRYPYVHAITDRTAQFQLPNVTIDNDGRFKCSLHNFSNLGIKSAQYLHVARRPIKPFLIGCIVDNWELLICSWGPNISIQDVHSRSPGSLSQILLWQHRGDGDTWQSCPEINNSEKCFWRFPNFTMEKDYCVMINVSNVVASNISSEVECRNPQFIVKPPPPTNLRQATTAPENDKMLLIEWDAPTTPKKLNYHLTVHSRWEVRTFTVFNKTSLNFSTVPFTDYHIRIVALPLEHGFPSNESSGKVSSSATVPWENPFLMRNFYSIDADNRKAVLYWQPIHEQYYCGPEFYYAVHRRTLSSSEEWRRINTTSNHSVEVELIEYANDILIVSQNKVGSAVQPSSMIHIPSDDQLFSDCEVVAEEDGNNVLVNWFMTKPSEERIPEYIMLFWCQPQHIYSHICKTPIQWKTLNASDRDFSITAEEDLQSLQIGVSIKFSNKSYSGIKWTHQLYSFNAVPDEPKQLQVSVPSGKHNELQIKWKSPNYRRHSAYVQSFTIFYCPVDVRVQCLHPSQNITVFKSHDHLKDNCSANDGICILRGLDPDTTYGIWMVSHARQQSITSEFVVGTTTQPWFTLGKIVGIVVGILLASAFVVFGLYAAFRCCDKYRKKMVSGFKVSLPPPRFQLASTSSEAPMLRDHTPLEYWRQPSRVSTGSGDSGHYSFPPSSPAMLPLLVEESDKQERLRIKNCYQQTNFNIEKTEEDEGSVNSALDVLSYKIVPNGNLKVERGQVNQTQYILPEQINQIGNGKIATDSCNCLVSETRGGNVDYCNDFPFANSNDTSDIGYTKIEQIPIMSNPSNQLMSNISSTEKIRNQDSGLLVRLDPVEFNPSTLQPAACHLDELLATLNTARPLTEDDVCANTGLFTISESYPLISMIAVECELPMHSKEALSSEESKLSEPTIHRVINQPIDNGYLPHTRLFGID